MKMRKIVSEVLKQNSIIFNFDDASTVAVTFKPEVEPGPAKRERARFVAEEFLAKRNPVERWQGTIDGEGNLID